jgi:hypothetical protein
MSGVERLEALAVQSAKQYDWIRLTEFESSTDQAQPSEPHVAVDRAEIDGWIEHLGSGSEWAIPSSELSCLATRLASLPKHKAKPQHQRYVACL